MFSVAMTQDQPAAEQLHPHPLNLTRAPNVPPPPIRAIVAAFRHGAGGRAVPTSWMKHVVSKVKNVYAMVDLLEEFCSRPLDVDWAAYMPEGLSPRDSKKVFIAAARADGHELTTIMQEYARQPQVRDRMKKRKQNLELNKERRIARYEEATAQRAAALALLEEADGERQTRASRARRA